MSKKKPDREPTALKASGTSPGRPSPNMEVTGRLRLSAIVATLIAVPLLLFLPVRHFALLSWDDDANITENSLYRPQPYAHLRELWSRPYFSAYIPITRMLWADLADVSVGPDGATIVSFDSQKYHLANVMAHVANVILIFLIVRLILRATSQNRRLSREGGDAGSLPPPGGAARQDLAAAFGALVFAVHPLQVESVAWVTGMKDLLGAFFSFLAIWLYLMFATATADRPQWGLFTGSSLAYIAAMLSKSTTVVLPAIAVLLDYLLALTVTTRPERVGQGNRGNRNSWIVPPYRLAALGVWLAVTIPIMFEANYADHLYAVAIPAAAVWQRPFVAGDSLAFYLLKILMPVSLGPDYGRTPVWLMRHAWSYVTIVVPIAVVAAAWWLRASSVVPMAAVGIFVLGLFPVSGLTPFTFQTFSSVADRYVYFVMLSPALALAAIFAALPARASVVSGACLLALLSLLTMRQIPVWKTTTTLFAHNLQVNPQSAVSYEYLGLPREAAGDIDGAIVNYRAAVRLNPRFTPVLNDLARALTHKWQADGSKPGLRNRLDEAEADLCEAVRLAPQFQQAHANLGYLYSVEGRNQEAIAQYREAVRYDPHDARSYLLLSVLYTRIGDYSDGLSCMRKAADLGEPQARQFFERAPRK